MSSCGKFCPIDTDVNSSCPCNAQFWYLPSLPFLPESLFVPIATSAGSAGRPAVVTSGTKPGSWPERTKSLIVVTLKLGLQESDKSIELPPNLRERHNCVHENWRYTPGPHQCEECYHNLPRYIFECRQCRILACSRCRRNRL